MNMLWMATPMLAEAEKEADFFIHYFINYFIFLAAHIIRPVCCAGTFLVMLSLIFFMPI